MAVWYIIFNLQKVSVMMENPCIVDNVEAVEGALNDGFDNLDSKPAFRYGYEYTLWWNWGKRKQYLETCRLQQDIKSAVATYW